MHLTWRKIDRTYTRQGQSSRISGNMDTTRRSRSHSNSGSSRTAADASAYTDVEAQSRGGKGTASSDGDQHHPAEKSLPTHEQGRGPAAATASGGDAIVPSSPDVNSNASSNTPTIINGDLETRQEKYELVNWDGDDDPSNPLNFTETRKWVIMMTIGTATLACTCASSMVASTYEGMMEDFNVSREVATLSLTL